MSIKVALIGTGIMGMDHARLFAEDLPNVELHTICDVDAARAKMVADQFGAKNVLTNPEAAATSSDVDAVVIASPDQFHAPLTKAAIQAGKYVLCEKPLSPSSAECIEVMELESKIGKQMSQIGFMRRFDPSYAEMKALLLQGKIGQALMFHNFHRNVCVPSNDFTPDMSISNSAPHEYDIARFMLDEEIVAVSVYQPKTQQPVKPVFMVLESASGVLINVEINNVAAYGYDVRAELVGEKGSLFLQPTNVLTEQHLDLGATKAYAADWRPRFAEAYRLQNKAWINSILTGKPSEIASNAWDGYCATRVAETGVAALKSGSRQVVELIDKPALYS